MRYVVAVLVVAGVYWQSSADQKPDPKKVAEEKLKQFEYPGSTRDKENVLGSIAQLVLITPDPLDKVNAWYHKAFIIDEDTTGGVANLPWPTGVKATEAKAQQQFGLFRDDIRSRLPNGNRVVRAGTVRHLVVRTPEHLMVVVLNRCPDDKETMISLIYLQDGKR